MYGMYQSQNPMYNPYTMPQSGYSNRENTQSLIRVNGIDGARAYQNMGANSTVALFDANDDLMYIKSTDGAGFPSVRTFRFEEVTGTNQVVSNNDYVSREEMENYVKQFISEQFQSKQNNIETVSE